MPTKLPTLEYAMTSWAPHTPVSYKLSNKIYYGRHLQLYSSFTAILSNLIRDSLHHRKNILKIEMLLKIIKSRHLLITKLQH